MFVTDAESLDRRVGVMMAAAESGGRNPEEILISMAGPGFVYEDEAAHHKALIERGAKRDLSPDEYAAFLDERNVPHGTPERAFEAIERMGEIGVGRYYVQEMSSLEEVDLDRLDLVFNSLTGS